MEYIKYEVLKKMEKSNIEDGTEESLKEAQISFEIEKHVSNRLNRVVLEIKDDLKAEREGKPIDVNALKTELRKKRYERDEINTKIEKLKESSRNHKKAISQWKQWYEGIDEEDKTEERKKLVNEINRRAAEIKKIEEEIGQSFPIEANIREEIEILEFKIKILEQDKFDGPIDDDPRLSPLLTQQKKVKQSLESTRVNFEKLRKKREQLVEPKPRPTPKTKPKGIPRTKQEQKLGTKVKPISKKDMKSKQRKQRGSKSKARKKQKEQKKSTEGNK